MSLKKLTSRALSSNENDNPYILKEDKKYSRYLDNIIKDYSVKQTKYIYSSSFFLILSSLLLLTLF